MQNMARLGEIKKAYNSAKSLTLFAKLLHLYIEIMSSKQSVEAIIN